jgi:hypothetical protein
MSDNSCEFYIQNSTNDSSYNYCASSVFYVSLDLMRSTFQFSSSDVSSNGLDISIIDNSSADITYYCNSYIYPEINFAHSMMFGPHSINSISDISGSNNLLKHDMLRYIAENMFGSSDLTNLIINRKDIIQNIEIQGWSFMNSNEVMLEYNNNNGNGLGNLDNSFNISKTIMKTIATYSPNRFNIKTNNEYNRIDNTTSQQSIPFVEGDTINYIVSINYPNNINNGLPINPRKYRIQLYLTNNSNYTNTEPHDSIYTIDPNNSYNITHTGVP